MPFAGQTKRIGKYAPCPEKWPLYSLYYAVCRTNETYRQVCAMPRKVASIQSLLCRLPDKRNVSASMRHAPKSGLYTVGTMPVAGQTKRIGKYAPCPEKWPLYSRHYAGCR